MNEWYANGLKFSCTQCGNCCTGPPGAVWFNETEGRAMAKKMGLSKKSFYEEFARKIGASWSLKERIFEGKYDCIFLDRSGKKPSCSLYEVRPMQCRTWPFWPESLASPEAWERIKRETPCEGMNQGKLIPIEEIRIQRDAK